MKNNGEIGVYETKTDRPAAAWMAGSNFRAARLKTMRAKSRAPLIIALALLAAGAGVCVFFLLS